MPNILTQIPYNFSLWRRPEFQTFSKALDISSPKDAVAPDLLKAIPILSDITVRDPLLNETNWNHIEKQKKTKIIAVINMSILKNFSILLTSKRRLIGS